MKSVQCAHGLLTAGRVGLAMARAHIRGALRPLGKPRMLRFSAPLLLAVAAALAACQAPSDGPPPASGTAETRALQKQVERDYGRQMSVMEQERRFQMRSVGP